MARTLGGALVGLFLLLLAAPAAADTAIGFESPSLQPCTTVATQFSGVRFVTTSPQPVGSIPLPSVVSPGRNGSARALQTGECSEEFPNPQFAMRLTQTRARVSLHVRAPDPNYDPAVQLRAYDTANARIDGNGSTYTTLTGGGAYVSLTAATADDTNRIATIVLVALNPHLLQGVRVHLDDVNLVDAAGAPPPAPDFTLGPARRTTLQQGFAGSVRVPVNRFNGSAGEMDYTVTNLPPGMRARVFPYADDLPEVNFEQEHFDIPPGDYEPMLTGIPRNASQGSAPRSTGLPLTISEYRPSLTITDPAEGVRLARAPYGPWVRGRFQSLRGGESQVCAVVTRTAVTPPAPGYCRGVVRGHDGTWEFFVEGVRSGDNWIHAFIRDRSGRVGTASRLLQVADERSGVDIRVTGVELTQGIQKISDGIQVPDRDGTNTLRYRGVQLVRGRNLWVRVFANTTAHATSAGTTPRVTARLRLLRNGREVAESPFLPTPSRLDMAIGPPYAQYAERADFNQGYRFTIPASIFAGGGTFTFEAQVNDSVDPIVECAGCAANNVLRVTDVGFRPMQTREIWPIRFHYDLGAGRREPSAHPRPLFQLTREVFPFPIVVHPWVARFDITRELQEAMAAGERAEGRIQHYVGDYERDHNPTNGPAIGVADGGYAGLMMRNVFCCEPLRIEPWAIVNMQRPLTSMAHEFGHTEDLEHADHACGGDSDGQTADDAWPESRGLLLGVGFDPTRRRAMPAYDPVSGAGVWYDHMSYCANNSGDPDSWVSSRNWDRLVDARNAGSAFASAEARPARATAAQAPTGPGLAVTAISAADGGGARITDVQPVDRGAVPSVAGGDVQLVVLGADGRPLSSTTVASSLVHPPAPGAAAFRVVTATVPAGSGPRAVQLVRGGAVSATRSASPAAPAVRLLAPRRGARVGRSLTVRWSGSDADGDRLRYAVDVADGPRARFKVVAAGVTGTSTTIPLSMLPPARAARIRVRALDGFRHAAAVVTGIRIPVAAPTLTIVEPAARAAVPADAAVPLRAEAFDARSRLLAGRALTWRVDGRKVATGALASVRDLRPGVRRITVTATGLGRSATAQLRLRVTKVTPRLLATGAPGRLAPRSRVLRLRLTASVPAQARIGGGRRAVRVALGRRPRTVRVPVRPGTRPLALAIRLRGGGGRATVPLRIPRG